MHEFVLTADITKMFRQVWVHPDDRPLQAILWREDSTQDIQVYQLNTVTYGTASASYHAMRCLRELAAAYRHEFPLAAKAVEEDFFMDDGLSGGRTLQAAIELQRQLTNLLMKGQFPLRKWRSNDPRVLQHLHDQAKSDHLLMISGENTLKTLGLLWNATQDCLQYQVKLPEETVDTKRTVLSKILQVFDPLGLVAPILLRGKIFMQRPWSIELEWDETLTQDLLAVWNDYYLSLPQLNELQISRNVNARNSQDTFDLIGFGDASERAFGACLYTVSIDTDGSLSSSLLQVKGSTPENNIFTEFGVRSCFTPLSVVSIGQNIIEE